ncbi:translation initiation factor IF-2 [Lacticaseibacillus paracasei subsp. paracasei Lpp219]|nr:translation initiation factor IF-2 [Lacticaseibacillus paracasei subsp. paracasei Lpp219]
MGKKRVYEFAKEMHVDNKDVIDIAKNLGIEVKKSHVLDRSRSGS